jgi:hypothetical protein
MIIPKTIDSLSLILANDYITESSAILKNEDSVLLTALSLAFARAAATVVLVVRQHRFSTETCQVQQTLTHLASNVWPFLIY